MRGAFSFQPNTTWNPTTHTNIAATLQLHHAAVVRLAAVQVWGRFGTGGQRALKLARLLDPTLPERALGLPAVSEESGRLRFASQVPFGRA